MRSPLLGLFGMVVALLGLFMAAWTQETNMFFVGMIFFGFGVGLNFWLISRATHSAKSREDRSAMQVAE